MSSLPRQFRRSKNRASAHPNGFTEETFADRPDIVTLRLELPDVDGLPVFIDSDHAATYEDRGGRTYVDLRVIEIRLTIGGKVEVLR